MKAHLSMTKYKKLDRYPEYEINQEGVIRHRETLKVLKPTPSFNGHMRVKLKNKTEYVGRLLAETFVPKIDDSLTDVRYIDGDKNNITIDNVEWATHHQTQYDSFGVGTNAPGGNMPPQRIFDAQNGQTYPSIKACSRETYISPTVIRRMIKGHKRFIKI